MKKGLYILFCFCSISFACQQEEAVVDNAMDRSIYLAATIENTLQSRTPYLLSAPTIDKPLWADVLASTTAFMFKNEDKNGSDGTVALHTKAKFTAGKEQLLNAAVYPKKDGNTPVYFVGLHPQTWTVASDGTSASYTFSGKEDVMFAPQIYGKYAANLNAATWPTFTFKHLLTWIRIQMVAENEDISAAWGKITGLTIKSQKGITVQLKNFAENYDVTDAAQFNADTDVNFTGDAVPLSFFKTDTDNVFPGTDGYQLNGPYGDEDIYDEVEEVAYSLCAPVKATAENKSEYTLTVTTAKRTIDVEVDLLTADNTPFVGSTINHQFTILLRFKLGNNISVTAQATDWVNGGLGNGEFKEQD